MCDTVLHRDSELDKTTFNHSTTSVVFAQEILTEISSENVMRDELMPE